MGETMGDLFAKARAEGLWFFCSYQQLWFTPGELEEHQRNGRFRWGPINWQLRPPSELIEQKERAEKEAQQELESALQRATCSASQVQS